MNSKKRKISPMEQWWIDEGRKREFDWVYRYLRLHKEFLDDPIYQKMYDFHRATLVAYLKKEKGFSKESDESLGETIDILADIFIRHSPERVNTYKWLVDELYKAFKELPDPIKIK